MAGRPKGENSNDGTKHLFTCFRLLGILMPQKHKLLYVIYSIVVNTLSVIILPITFSLSYLTAIEEMTLNQLLTSLQTGINMLACITKFIIIAFMRREVLRVGAMIEQFDDRPMHPYDVHEIRKVVNFGRRLVIVFCVINFSYSISVLLGAIYSGHPPFSLYNPFLDWRLSKRNFAIASLIEFAVINIICLQNVANDTFAIIYVRIVHTQMKMLIERVARIGSNSGNTQEDNLRELLRCIRDHKTLINLSNSIGEVISLTVFIQFMISGLALGVAFINISAFGDRSTITGSVFFIGGIVVEMLPICYFVNCLVDDAQRLPDAIFHLRWMEENRAFRQNCILFIHRSQQSMVFMAGKIFPITLSSFLAIIKFSFSLCTLLSTMDLAARFNQQ